MGVGGGFWDELRPVKKYKEIEWLQGKRLAIDLSYWVVQQQEAVGGLARKPHLRILFFRILNLVCRGGALPVFIVDGTPPPEKFQERHGRISGSPISPVVREAITGASVPARNSAFQQSIDECVELLELLGIPVLQAEWEAEGLCAELDREGLVDACVTPDSDAFLHGAKCVIKTLQLDPKDPLVEIYAADDIETILGLQRQHMVAIALLVGCDYDKKGVAGIGCSNAVRLVQSFHKEEILDRLRAWGRGELAGNAISVSSELEGDENNATCIRLGFGESQNSVCETSKALLHCTNCGHPGTKREHTLSKCSVCKEVGNSVEGSELGCIKKEKGFQCLCLACAEKRESKKRKKRNEWWDKYCTKMASTDGFPNERIINIFLRPGLSNLAGDKAPASIIKWRTPNMELLEDFMLRNLHWDPLYVRRHTFPLLSTIYLKGLAATNRHEPRVWNDYPFEDSIIGRFVPDSIQRIKVEHSKEFYMLRWQCLASDLPGNKDWFGSKKTVISPQSAALTSSADTSKGGSEDQETFGSDGDPSVIEAELEDVDCVFTTIEDMRLVEAACPELVESFEQEQAMKLMAKAMKKGSKRKVVAAAELLDGSQLSIKSFFKVKKSSVSMSRAEISQIERREGFGVQGVSFVPDAKEKSGDCSLPSKPLKGLGHPPVRRNLFP